MNPHIISLLLCCNIITAAQKPGDNFAENGIYRSDTDFVHHKLILPFNKSNSHGTRFKSPLGHYNELWLKTKDSTYKFYNDDIWGYRKRGEDFRIYENEIYKINYTGKIVIYTIYSTPGNGNGITSYFSKTLTSPAYYLSKKMLREVYHADKRFLQKIDEMKWNSSIYKWNKGKGYYEFIDWLE